mgnify:FL=1
MAPASNASARRSRTNIASAAYPTLAAAFPAVAAALGDDAFAAAIDAFIHAQSPTVVAPNDLPAAFAQFARQQRLSPSWIVDLAGFELAIATAASGVDVAAQGVDVLAAIPLDSRADVRFEMHPNAAMWTLSRPACDALAAGRPTLAELIADSRTSGPLTLLVAAQRGVVCFRVLERAEAAMFGPLWRGDCLSEALNQALADDPTLEEAILSSFSAFAERWVRDCVVIAVRW